MFKRRLIRWLIESSVALAVTFFIGRWAIYIAYLERGYEAVGGEYCLMIMTCWATYRAIHYIFNIFEEYEIWERLSKKRSNDSNPNAD